MSRQSKQLANATRAKALKGGGPASTTPKHGKKRENRIYTAKNRSLSEFQERNKRNKKAQQAEAQ
jgi:hypothetical protein